MPHFRFGIPGLSDSMNAALTWLIEQGGVRAWPDVIAGASYPFDARHVRVTRPTIAALIARGLLTQGPRQIVQVTGQACSLIRDHFGPHPESVMAAAVWDQAHNHADYRREKGLDVPPAPPAPAGGYRIGTGRAACEALIRAQIHQVFTAAGVPGWKQAGAAARFDAAVRRIADTWAADVQATPAAEPALADVALVRAEAKLTPQGWFALDRIETFIRECA